MNMKSLPRGSHDHYVPVREFGLEELGGVLQVPFRVIFVIAMALHVFSKILKKKYGER